MCSFLNADVGVAAVSDIINQTVYLIDEPGI